MSPRTRRRLANLLRDADHSLFLGVAARRWCAAESALSRLSRSADHGLLWGGIAVGMWALGGARSRRAAVRGMASLALASATVNTVGKGAAGRTRPLLDAVPVIRHLSRQPVTSSFPSGHAASAAAFVVGAAFESPRWGAVLAPLAASVAFSRVSTGVHHPGDVVAGAVLGTSTAYAVRGLTPSRAQLPRPARPCPGIPALPDGEGLIVVVNPSSGTQPRVADPVRQLKAALPRAEVVLYDEDAGPLPAVLADAAREAAARDGALGVCGGDGTVNAAATVALSFQVPLMVLPGGTFNHFAADLGIDTVADACAALAQGHAVRTDVGRVRPLAPTGQEMSDPIHFLNTFSIGVYPELVRFRERWAAKVGGPAATLLGVARILRAARPLRADVNGRRRSFWLLFAGNGVYRSVGIAPVRRHDLADGVLDIRIAHAGQFARTRLLAAACVGRLTRAPFYAAAHRERLLISGLPDGTRMAFDGEVAEAPPTLLLDTLREALRVYSPMGNTVGSELRPPSGRSISTSSGRVDGLAMGVRAARRRKMR